MAERAARLQTIGDFFMGFGLLSKGFESYPGLTRLCQITRPSRKTDRGLDTEASHCRDARGEPRGASHRRQDPQSHLEGLNTNKCAPQNVPKTKRATLRMRRPTGFPVGRLYNGSRRVKIWLLNHGPPAAAL